MFFVVDAGYNIKRIVQTAPVTFICNGCGETISVDEFDTNTGRCQRCIERCVPCNIGDDGLFPWERDLVKHGVSR